jgi:hypothetical protein
MNIAIILKLIEVILPILPTDLIEKIFDNIILHLKEATSKTHNPVDDVVLAVVANIIELVYKTLKGKPDLPLTDVLDKIKAIK